MTFLDFWLENRESASLIVGASEVVHSSLTSNTNSMSYFIRIRRNRELPAMPTSQRTNEFFSLPSLAITNDSSFGDLFGIADLTRLQLRKCNNHLVSFIKVDGLSVSYIVIIFATIKSRALVYPSMECRNFWHHEIKKVGLSFYGVSTFSTSLNQERWSSAT